MSEEKKQDFAENAKAQIENVIKTREVIEKIDAIIAGETIMTATNAIAYFVAKIEFVAKDAMEQTGESKADFKAYFEKTVDIARAALAAAIENK